MSSPPNALPAHWVDRLFDRFTAVYGSQRIGTMWNGTDINAVKAIWGEQLGRFQPATISAALQRLVDSGDGWPPTLPEFVEACRQASLGRQQAQDSTALPAPGQNVTDAATARANLAKIREMLRSAVKVMP